MILRSGVLFLRQETHPFPPTPPDLKPILSIYCRMSHQNKWLLSHFLQSISVFYYHLSTAKEATLFTVTHGENPG
ncbi:hypothetical protein ES288_A05G294800v1, partial [Gossypium darwinii]